MYQSFFYSQSISFSKDKNKNQASNQDYDLLQILKIQIMNSCFSNLEKPLSTDFEILDYDFLFFKSWKPISTDFESWILLIPSHHFLYQSFFLIQSKSLSENQKIKSSFNDLGCL